MECILRKQKIFKVINKTSIVIWSLKSCILNQSPLLLGGAKLFDFWLWKTIAAPLRMHADISESGS